MAYPGPSVGPWQISEIDIHLLNEVFRQIEEQITLLRGLRATTVNTSTGTTTTVPITIGPHTHESPTTGGKISHDDALDDVSANDHHDELHDHSGDGSGGFLAPALDRADGWATSKPADFIIAGNNITIVESDESEGLVISASGSGSSVTVQEVDGAPSVVGVSTINVTNGTLTDNGGGSVTIDIGTGGTDVQWSVLASAAELIFDSDGDVIMTELCQPSSCS